MNPWPVEGFEPDEVHLPRPGHADLVGAQKYGHTDIRNVLERASARETAARVAAGSIARGFLTALGVEVHSHVPADRLGRGAGARRTSTPADFDGVDDDPVRCLDPEASAAMVDEINRLRKANESLGGSFEVRAFGLVPGLGSHISWEDRLDGRLAGAVASIQSVKGVAIGEAWDVAGRPGSEAHDEIFWSEKDGYFRETNHAGGLEGGMTNGQPLSVRAAIKPISTLTKPLRSVDTETKAAGAGAARAHRLDRRPGRRRRRRGDGLPDPRPLLPREVRRRPHRRRARRRRRLQAAHRLPRVSAVSRPAIVFIGFMGAGKSDRARRRPRAPAWRRPRSTTLMERELRDADRRGLRARTARRRFRAREAEVVGALLEEADGGAIALGGGSVLSERIRAALDRHIVVWLQVDADEAWRRIAHSDRPLATSAEDVERAAGDAPAALRGAGRRGRADRATATIVGRALPAIQALAELPAGTKLLWAASASGEYPVLVGRGLLDAGWWPLEGRRFLRHRHGRRRRSTPSASSRSRPGVEVEPGEGAKTMAEAERVLRELARAGMTREDHVVALGGGVVGDLAGFCAHLYQRGVPVVQVPTTLVAQVDSAYGGKTGVDLPEGKNYAGAYHLPAAVIADTDDAGDAAARRSWPPASSRC